MPRLLRTGSLLLGGLVSLTLLVGASGVLYLVRPFSDVGGPMVANALPLDELSHHSSMPLLVFVPVWAAFALTLGLLARLLRIERLTAALGLALAVTSFCFVATGVSILIVRQIPVLESFHAAARMPAVYLPGALAGAAGALLCRRGEHHRPRAPFLLSLLVALAGLLDLVAAMFPERGGDVIEQLAPNAVQGISNALLAPLGLGLLVSARGLARRRQRAWQLAVALLGGSAALHLLHRVDYGAAATVLVALVLIARRDDFDRSGDRDRRRRLAVRAGLLVAAIYVYAAAALWTDRLVTDRPFTMVSALRETTTALLGATARGPMYLSGGFDHWFSISVFALGLAAAAVVTASWLAPWRYRLVSDRPGRARACALVGHFGVDTLAPFALRADKSYFFSDDERAFLAYKVVAGVAVVSGDPVGPSDAIAELLRRFLAFARERDWRVAVLGVGERAVDLYRAAGLHVLYHGDEAVVQTSGFSLEGRAIRKVRQSVARLEREGYSAEVLYAGDVDTGLRTQLQAIFDEWRGSSRVKGFTMELDSLFRLEQKDAIFVVGRDAQGVPQGFLHFVVAGPGRALSLSSMPRRRTTPNGLNEWLVVTMIAWAREHGFERVSLNFTPFAALLSAEREQLSTVKRLQLRFLGALKDHGFQLDNLLAFNSKFFPCWERRYVVYEGLLDLPRVGLAGLAAEGYLALPRTRP